MILGRNFVGNALEGDDPVPSAIVRELSLEGFCVRDGKVIGGSDLDLLAFCFEAAGIRPHVSANDYSSIPGLFPRSRHTADRVIPVFVVGVNGELSVPARRVGNQLLTDEEISLW